MIIHLIKSPSQLTVLRRRAYLAAWPLHRQMEAHAEAAAGRPALLSQMLTEMAAIKDAYPYPEPTP